MSTVIGVNFGPRDLVKSGKTDHSAFILSRPEWLSVQAYVNNALALPTTEKDLKALLGQGAPADMTDFKDMIACYSNIKTHCSNWKDNIFPATVSLASDIVDYAANAETYYAKILDNAQTLSTKPVGSPEYVAAKAALPALLDVVRNDARDKATKAAGVQAKIVQFVNDTKTDQTKLQGPDGKSGVVDDIKKKYGKNSDQIKNINDEIQELAKKIKEDQDKYEHDVIVAATSPTYVWIWPFGTIAAVVVAGVYGDRAKKDLDRLHAEQQGLKDKSAELDAILKLLGALNLAQSSVNDIRDKLNAALPVIQKIQGIWASIADDMDKIAPMIDKQIEKVPPIIMSVGVENVIKAWKSVAGEADNYRVNAYITVAPTAAQAA